MRKFLLLVPILFTVLSVHASGQNLPPHFVKVSDSIYRGGRPSAVDLQSLAQLGIRLDINLQGGDLNNWVVRALIKEKEPGENPALIASEKVTALSLGLNFVNFPLDCFDSITAQEDQMIDQALVLLARATKEKPVYLHCEHGQDRTGLVMALYRIQHDGWSAEAAHEEWETLGHNELKQIGLFHLDDYFWRKAASLQK